MHFSSPLLLVTALVQQAIAQGTNGFVQLPIPTLPSNPPQTPAQADRGLKVGRFPAQLELLQPSLDTGLSSYQKVSQNLVGNYTFAASDVLADLTRRWAYAFMQLYPNVTITIPAPYAGSLGALELIAGNLSGVFVSRELKPSDISSFKSAFGYDPSSVPISQGSYRQFGFLDTMVFAVNKNNPIESLNFDQLDSILSTTLNRGGKAIRTWGEVGVKGTLANQTIQVYGITPWNGIEEFMRQRVLNYNGKRGEWRNGNKSDPAYDPAVHWDPLIFNQTRHPFEDPAGLSYTGVAYVDFPVKLLAVNNNTNDIPVSPTYENVANGIYPLSRVCYLNTNIDPKKGQDPVLKELTKFVISKQGQQILLSQGVFLPFTAPQQQASLKMIG